MDVVFWHNIISPHQAPFMRELAEAGHQVLVVASEEMSADRRQLGWGVPSLGPARIISGPNQREVNRIVEASGSDSIHVIAGARGTPLGRQAALACRAANRRMGLITESPDPRGAAGLLRRAKYSWERVTVGRQFDFILAMGQRGVRWFKLCGYAQSRIFPFAYVTERPEVSTNAEIERPFRFLYIGQLIHRKGVDLLLQALARLTFAELSVVGDGSERGSLEKLGLDLGLGNRVSWLGKMDSAQAQARLYSADALVLPSREDGWGAVVNESLLAGTPVICSTACGASDLIRHPWLGTVFQANRVSALSEALAARSAEGRVSPEQRQRIRTWARCIEAPSVAKYVAGVLAHVYHRSPKPEAPWRMSYPDYSARIKTVLTAKP